MAKINVPTLQSKITLAADWHFDLNERYENRAMIRALKAAPPDYTTSRPKKDWPAMLPAGTTLTVRTYYIRQGQPANDAVRLTGPAKPGGGNHTFWVWLRDFNNIETAP